MAAIAVAGVGLMVVCSSSVAAAMMMGGEEKEDPVVPKTPAEVAAAKAKADADADADADEEDVSTGAALPSTPPAVAAETLYTPPPPPPPVPENVGGVTTVQLCSPWKARDCNRAAAVMTCPEFKACWQSNKQAPCAGEAWFNKCGW
mgnify:CR=1 FL=1